ncbi:Ppx/GppA family phosphatase [Caulobacter sp. SLTY]|uniref:Ppx/GppA family phosphatase n=1 Tax=Caulobacter sp. SLTY TaxID=2683262 RepID=UPI0014134C8F|nr:Ppx/GppA phosphatase family protein [Caulobacter sp. SLTY]NBB17056.1 Ppx/GppA family phosphatase [Caulobacter sp. SLTY]
MNDSPGHDAAVIDVGSNSVRLVLYRVEGRSMWTVFNEKVLAGLGRDLKETGRLSPEGAASALSALKRFRIVVDRLPPERVFTAATAAIRDAEDGPPFAGRVQAETGLSLRVLTGAEEARYAALGVLAGAPAGDGVVGDLGGASLELTPIGPKGAGEGITLPLGPFSFGPYPDDDPEIRRREVDARLEGLERFHTESFHAVGGAWRNLALIHMHMTGYPLRVVHQYEMSRAEALNACRFVASQSRRSLEAVEGVSKKRAETLPHAAVVLERLIIALGIERIDLSAYGVREGLLFEAMAPTVQALDPLIEGCAALSVRTGADATLGPTLDAWLTPVFDALEPVFGARDAILRAAACRLADLGARLHPDHRADLVFEQVLRAPVAGQSHAERAFLAVAAFSRHSSSNNTPEPSTIARLLPEAARRRARALGAAIRFGCDLTGRDSALLAHTRLALKGDRLLLTTDADRADLLLGEQTSRRAAALAGHLDAKVEIRVS